MNHPSSIIANEVSSDWLPFIENVKLSLKDDIRNFKAGRIDCFYRAWTDITSDKFILNLIRNGIFIEFKDFTPQVEVPRQYNFNDIEHQAILNEIKSLLNKKVIKEVSHCKGEFISNIFVRPKKDGKFRMILNLCGLNENVVYHKFKMSTLQSAINLMTKNCFMATLDWKDAYYCVPIHKVHKKTSEISF